MQFAVTTACAFTRNAFAVQGGPALLVKFPTQPVNVESMASAMEGCAYVTTVGVVKTAQCIFHLQV